jgi:hypothetical protein
MECRYSRYGREESEFLLTTAGKHGLIVTGGSDYHGCNKRDLRLGQLSIDDPGCTIDTAL